MWKPISGYHGHAVERKIRYSGWVITILYRLVQPGSTIVRIGRSAAETLPADNSRCNHRGEDFAGWQCPRATTPISVNAMTGDIIQMRSAHLYDFGGNLIVSVPLPATTLNSRCIRDFPSGNILYFVPTPPNFAETYFEYNQDSAGRLAIDCVRGRSKSPSTSP